jgi:hypothetical protein
MPAKKPKTIRVIAAELDMSLGHLRDAMKAGIDPQDRKALKKWKATIRPRVDSRSDMAEPPKSKATRTAEMTIEQIVSALKAKGITVAEATTLKRQLEGLKLAIQIDKESNRLLSRADVHMRDTRIGSAVAAAMRALETELPQLLLGLPLERGRPITKEKCRAIQAMLADELSEFWKEHPEK